MQPSSKRWRPIGIGSTKVPEMGAFVIPAFQAGGTIGTVVRELRAASDEPILVVDDGSTDDTAEQAARAGATVLSHSHNRGKGAALKSALDWAKQRGFDAIVTLDADGQHPPREAARLMQLETPRAALVLGVRDLAAAGAPLANQRSNAFSNLVLSWFAGERLLDTQCGLRRYPVLATLELAAQDDGFAFEAEVVLRAARRGLPIVQRSCEVLYPKDRTTHFDNLRDPTRIVLRVVRTVLAVPHHRALRRWGRRAASALVLLAGVGLALHAAVRQRAHMTAPTSIFPRAPRTLVGERRRVGRSMAERRQGIWEVFLHGTPSEIGWAHAALLREEMIQTEGALLGRFEHYVPSAGLRALLLDLALARYQGLDAKMSLDRTRELAAAAIAFQPDPFADFFPTFQRFVYLSALYDISLSFEHSPLLGCTTFTVDETRSRRGPLLARVFDFEVDDVFDESKAVFFVQEEGKIPYASVAWPGLVGVVSGMNLAGVAVVVHGARGGPFSAQGEPVVHALRRVLGEAKTSEDAVRLLDARPAMVSHIVVVQDSSGTALRIERSVGRPGAVIPLGEVAATTNHFEGPLASDAKNQRVLRESSTLPRRRRGDRLCQTAPDKVEPSDLLLWLRDGRDAEGRELPAGDRRAIDAGIATHAVIADTQSRTLWVSRGPHLDGPLVEYALQPVFARGGLEDASVLHPTLPARR